MKRIFITSFFCVLTIFVSAQKYHDAAAFDVRGNVKECVVRQSNEAEPGYYRFTSDGVLFYHWNDNISGKSTLHRDAAGYLLRLYDNGSYYAFVYDDAHRVLSKESGMSADVFGNYTVYLFYQYNEKGDVVAEKILSPANEGSTYVYTRYDSKGNWTERNVFDLATNSFEYKETRKISYWTNDEKPKENKHVSKEWIIKRVPKKFPPVKAKKGDFNQLVLHPFGAKNLSPNCTADELMSACEKMKLNAVCKLHEFDGGRYGTVEITEKSPYSLGALYGEVFKGVFCYKLFDAVVVAEAGFVDKDGTLFNWEYYLYPLKNSKDSIDDIFEKAVTALAKSGLKVKLKSALDNEIKYYIYELEGAGLSKVTVSTAGSFVKISVEPS